MPRASAPAGVDLDKEVDVESPPLEVLPPDGFNPLAKRDRRFIPTDEERKIVRELAVWGVPFADICQQVINPETGRPIGTKTLSDAFRDELDSGMAQANVRIANSSYLQAVGWPAEYDAQGNCIRPFQPPVPMMTKWLGQVRLGYTEKVVIEHQQQQSHEAIGQAIAGMSYEDMLALREIVQRARSAPKVK